MRIRLIINGQGFHRDVKDAFVWRGSLRKIPEWISDRLNRGDAIQTRTGGIMLKDKNGYHIADKGMLILYFGDDQVDVLWWFKQDRSLTDETD